MGPQDTNRAQLGRVQARLSRWREQHGGRGRPIPEELWAAAVQVAGTAGVDTTARALGIDRGRLARRVALSRASVATSAPLALASEAFVEVDTLKVMGRGRVIVRVAGPDGEQLEVEFPNGVSTADVTAVASALWRP